MKKATTNTTNIDLNTAIRNARAKGFEIEINNFEIEICKPGAFSYAVFNRNDPAQVCEALEYINENTRRA